MSYLARRVAALVATVILAPTLAITVFFGLSGRMDQPAPAFARDYAVATFWHLDLGTSSTYQESVSTVIPYWPGFMILIFFAPGTGYILELPFVSALDEYRDIEGNPFEWFKALWLPWLMVGLPLAAAVLRMTETAMREAMGEDFLRTAQAKGLSDGAVLRRHALPLAVAPVAALTGANIALVITNVALMESAFNIPGIYREITQISSFSDWPLLQGMIIETTALIVIANMAADALQARLDPTVR